MSTNWTSQFLIALAFAAALGNALAIGVHVFSWWLRRSAWWMSIMAALGGVVLLLSWCGLANLCFIWSDGYRYSLNGINASPDGWQLQVTFSFFLASSVAFIIIGSVGSVQERQIPARWSVACLCFGFELALASLAGFVVSMLFDTSILNAWLTSSYDSIMMKAMFVGIFILSLLALAFFRPFFLAVLKYLSFI